MDCVLSDLFVMIVESENLHCLTYCQSYATLLSLLDTELVMLMHIDYVARVTFDIEIGARAHFV